MGTAPDPAPFPFGTTRALRGCVVTADHLASQAGLAILRLGGNAVDAAIAAGAAITVTGPHMCGMGGDLFALVHTGRRVVGLNASGRAGSGAHAETLRTLGHRTVPFRHEIRAVTVPGCVDGWLALHERFGSLSLDDLLAPAVELAEQGFPASPLLVAACSLLDQAGRSSLRELTGAATRPGAPVIRPGAARALRAIAARGRDGFYGGEFGTGLLELGRGVFAPDDLVRSHADWVEPLSATAFGVELHTIGPNAQGYLALATAALVEAVGLPDDPDDERWAHVMVEAALTAGRDRPAVLHEGADGAALLAAARARVGEIDPERASAVSAPAAGGDTTYLCTADGHGMAVSLICSNASGFGSWLVEPATGIPLHNRGIGFNLESGHPAELAPGRRPPHTLSPLLVTRHGALAAALGTMGGDAQPQILAQVAARLFAHGWSPARALTAARWVLRGPSTGFDTWAGPSRPDVAVEAHAPPSWVDGLRTRGHPVHVERSWDAGFGHAHAIVVEPEGVLAAAADPRTRIGSVAAR